MSECKCLFGRQPREDFRCKNSNCWECGWHKNVDAWRRELLRKKGLTKCKDGLRRLVLPAKK